MCGIAGCVYESGVGNARDYVERMIQAQLHRGPDVNSVWCGCSYLQPPGDPCFDHVAMGNARLAVLDLRDIANQPMISPEGTVVTANCEIYNHRELRQQLTDYQFQSESDTEVILAAYEKWGPDCLFQFEGMWAFAIWNPDQQTLWLARDRFGVKPLYYTWHNGAFLFASEIKAFFAAGVRPEPNEYIWDTYLRDNTYDHDPNQTFWKNISAVPPGHSILFKRGNSYTTRWYDLAEATTTPDERPSEAVREEYLSLMRDSVSLRLRSDVPTGLALSGGLDSAILCHLMTEQQQDIKAYVFGCDSIYDEVAWAEEVVKSTEGVDLSSVTLTPFEVPQLANDVYWYQDEPYGGLPTLAYAKIFSAAYEDGIKVMLDGQGMDEQWAGYPWYTGDPTQQQIADITQYKLPRALRFNDRISMRSSVELREPFLDHRLVELALRQPVNRKIRGSTRKYFLREIARYLGIPETVIQAPKRRVQAPQREWLTGLLNPWVKEQLASGPTELTDLWKICQHSPNGPRGFALWQATTLGLFTNYCTEIGKY